MNIPTSSGSWDGHQSHSQWGTLWQVPTCTNNPARRSASSCVMRAPGARVVVVDPTVWSLPISCAFGASYSTMRVQPMDPFLGLHRRAASDASSSQHPPSPLQRRKNPRGSVEWQEWRAERPAQQTRLRESKEMRENGSRKSRGLSRQDCWQIKPISASKISGMQGP